jgi:Na+/proline symporter
MLSLAILVFFVAMMFIGVISPRAKNGDDFNVAGRNQHWIWLFAGFLPPNRRGATSR